MEHALGDAIPLRTIAVRWSVSKTALIRHKQTHLPLRPMPVPYSASALVATRPNGNHLFPEISAPKKRAFLSAFAQLGRRAAAAAAIGIDSRTHRYWMQNDPVYADAFQRAEAVVADRIEDEIFRRGVEGVERGVWHNGVQVGTERHYSDTLLIFAAKGARPEKYRDRADTTHHISPALAALMQQWQALREQPAPAHQALPPADATDAAVVPLEDIRTPGRARRADVFNMLDALNQHDIEGDTDDDS
jgi:hypothetical protein